MKLETGAFLSVEVRGGDTGRPLEKASVKVYAGGVGDTDADGRIRLGPFQPGKKRVTVEVPGYRICREDVECAAGRTTAFIAVLDRGMGIAGKVVLRDGTPAAGAWVRWRGDGDRDCRQVIRAAEDGTFYLRGLPDRTVRIDGALTYAAGRPYRGTGLIDAGTTDVILPPDLTLSGRVVGSDGRPHEDYDGQLWRWTRTGGWQPVATLDEGGLLERGLPAGPVALVWLPYAHSGFDEPEGGPDRLGLPVSWYQAGAKDIVFTVPSR